MIFASTPQAHIVTNISDMVSHAGFHPYISRRSVKTKSAVRIHKWKFATYY